MWLPYYDIKNLVIRLRHDFVDPYSKTALSMASYRDTYEMQMGSNKEEFSKVYDKRIFELNSKLAAERGSASSAVQVSSLNLNFTWFCSFFLHTYEY